MNQFSEALKEKLPDLYSKDLVEVLFSQPYCKRKILEEAGLMSLKTAGLYLNKLEEAGFLTSVKVGKEKLYINKPLYKELVLTRVKHCYFYSRKTDERSQRPCL
jgi:hypothetical protein